MDTLQEVGEQRGRDGDLGALEDGSSGVACHPGSYLDQLELYAPQGPVGDLARQREAGQEVAHVVGQDEKGQADLLGDEPGAG